MKKILVIEDHDDLRDNTMELLQLGGYSVQTAKDGREGIEKAFEEKPDLILCDIMMPELDGYGVLHVIQSNAALKGTPFIFLSAKNSKEDVRKGMSLGADDYIQKPYDATDLLNAIEARLKRLECCVPPSRTGPGSINELLKALGGEEALQNFVAGRHVDTFHKRERIFSEGNRPLRLFYILKGKVKIYKTNEDGKTFILKILNPGEFFGYAALLEQSVYRDNAMAMDPCEIACIPRVEFEELLRSNADVMRKFTRILAHEISEQEELLIQIAYNSLRRKVASALIKVHDTFTETHDEEAISISRDNLAALAGTATESLIRTLTDFKEEKLINITDGKINILNKPKLKKMVN
jgi:DNA-binding response OmpR family regulator